LSALLSLIFCLDFLEKISGCQVWLVGCGVTIFMDGVHCFADIDQADLLGVVRGLLG
jgi:hypothetical protein